MICQAKGCRNRARPKGRFCSPACRTRDWKARTNYQRPEPRSSNGNAAERRYGGLTLSYPKTFRNLIEDLSEFVEVHRIEVSLRRSLPARQKQRLEARGR